MLLSSPEHKFQVLDPNWILIEIYSFTFSWQVALRLVAPTSIRTAACFWWDGDGEATIDKKSTIGKKVELVWNDALVRGDFGPAPLRRGLSSPHPFGNKCCLVQGGDCVGFLEEYLKWYKKVGAGNEDYLPRQAIQESSDD